MKLLLLFFIFSLLAITAEARKGTRGGSDTDSGSDFDSEFDDDDTRPLLPGKGKGTLNAHKGSFDITSCGLTAEEENDINKAKEYICYYVFRTVDEKKKSGKRATEKEMEIENECLKITSRNDLKKKYGGATGIFKKFNPFGVKAIFEKVKRNKCLNNDKIIEYAVGKDAGKY